MFTKTQRYVLRTVLRRQHAKAGISPHRQLPTGERRHKPTGTQAQSGPRFAATHTHTDCGRRPEIPRLHACPQIARQLPEGRQHHEAYI